jgi:hypothetical protein
MEDTKKCTKCGEELPLSRFYNKKYKSGKVGLGSRCKKCIAIYAARRRKSSPEKVSEVRRRWRGNNLEKVRESGYKWRENNREGAIARSAKWREENPERAREAARQWRKNNPEKELEAHRNWQKNNPEKVLQSSLKWQRNNPKNIRKACLRWRGKNPGYFAKRNRERRAVDVDFKLKQNISRAIRRAISDNSRAGHTIDLLGCSIEELRNHLERLFQPGMTWDNYGVHGWHLDHAVPLSYFDMSDPEQQKRAWHYTNLQPLWAKDNIRKSNKIIEQQLVLL